jgi:hypothetical protein
MDDCKLHTILKNAFKKSGKVFCLEVVDEVTSEIYDKAKDNGLRGWLMAERCITDVKTVTRNELDKRGLTDIYSLIDWGACPAS